jgi:hypothetical protein
LLRRLGFLLILIAALVITFSLSRLTASWHYVVPVQPGEVAYVATFDHLIEDWNQYAGRLEAQVSDGVLRLNVGDIESGPFSTTRQHFSDFDLRVQATPIDGPLNNGYGVIFRLQDNDNTSPSDDSYYLFLISSDGYYEVKRVIGREEKLLSGWIDTPLVNQGIGATNWLRVVANGDRFQFFVNGQPLQVCVPTNPEGESTYFRGECIDGAMQDTLVDSTIPNGQLGVVALSIDEPGVVVEFDNFLVYGPEAING